MVAGSGGYFFGPSPDDHLDGDVHARQLGTHLRKHGLPLGFRTRNRRLDGTLALFGLLPVGWRGRNGGAGCLRPHSTVPNLGASGAIAAVMGAFLVTFPRDEIRTILVIFIFIRVAYIPAVLLIGVWFLLQLWNAGAIAPQEPNGVAYLAHIGGFMFGAVFARLFQSRTSIRG